MWKYMAGIIVVAPLAISSPTLAQPSQSEIENLADAVGSTTADFEACGEASMARRIRSKYRSIATSCTSDSHDKNSALNAYDLSYANRLNEVSAVGGACRGNNSSRFRTIMDALGRALDEC